MCGVGMDGQAWAAGALSATASAVAGKATRVMPMPTQRVLRVALVVPLSGRTAWWDMVWSDIECCVEFICCLLANRGGLSVASLPRAHGGLNAKD